MDTDFTDEQTESTYGYPPGWSLKSLQAQVRDIERYFPRLNLAHVPQLASRYWADGRLVLPQGADDLVIIPKPSVIERWGNGHATWPTYHRAVACMHAVLDRTPLDSTFQETFSPENLAVTVQTAYAYRELESMPGDVMVIAVQMGLLHRGRSVRCARSMFGPKEFGLDAYMIASILLLNPRRMMDQTGLWIDCAGSMKHRHHDAGNFSHIPCWGRSKHGRWNYHVRPIFCARTEYGSASGFLP